MEKNKAIPEGYMTVGELAKKMGVSVRTLQYYDKKGLLSPSLTSEGGRRLYNDKDIIKLHQILSLKHLEFSLDDIKKLLILPDTPDEVANVLAEQASVIRKKIESLSESLREIELLQEEVRQMQAVDFKKYADIIVNLQMKNDYYWLIKHIDDQTLDYMRSRFDMDSGSTFMQTFTQLQERAILLHKDGVRADSKEGRLFAKAYWDMITEFTNGDTDILSSLLDSGKHMNPNNKEQEKQLLANAFIESALDAYFTSLGIDPFQTIH